MSNVIGSKTLQSQALFDVKEKFEIPTTTYKFGYKCRLSIKKPIVLYNIFGTPGL
jgi:hypothetical protein